MTPGVRRELLAVVVGVVMTMAALHTPWFWFAMSSVGYGLQGMSQGWLPMVEWALVAAALIGWVTFYPSYQLTKHAESILQYL